MLFSRGNCTFISITLTILSSGCRVHLPHKYHNLHKIPQLNVTSNTIFTRFGEPKFCKSDTLLCSYVTYTNSTVWCVALEYVIHPLSHIWRVGATQLSYRIYNDTRHKWRPNLICLHAGLMHIKSHRNNISKCTKGCNQSEDKFIIFRELYS